MGEIEPITAREFHASEGAEDWRVVGDGAGAIFQTGSFAASCRLVAAFGDVPGTEGGSPDIDVRPDGVTVRLLTRSDDYYGMSHRDLELARRLSAVAEAHGAVADPAAVQSVLVVPGAPDAAGIMPFWEAALGYVRRPDSPDEDLVDPRRRGPDLWFEAMREPRGDEGGAIHVAVFVPIGQGQARVEAALGAGGHVVYDKLAPAWWTLADAAGNQVDISTLEGRD